MDDKNIFRNDTEFSIADMEETKLAFSSIKTIENNANEIALKPGMVFGGQYCLVRSAGIGKMGEVWKAYDRIGERSVALKFVPRNIENYDLEIKKSKKCFQAVYKLNHQYICPIHAIVEDDKFGYSHVMKWMPGTLDDFQKEVAGPGNPLDFKLAMAILSNLAEALDYIHKENVIHRDVKPKNVCITQNEDRSFAYASLIDFGLASSVEYYKNNFEPRTGTISGTPVYMPPEQWINEVQSPQTDQYALGIIAYKLLSGHVPFTNSSIKELRGAIFYEQPKIIPGIPRFANQALQKALSKNPKERFNTCQEFVHALKGTARKQIKIVTSLFALFVFLTVLPFVYFLVNRADEIDIAKNDPLPVFESLLVKYTGKDYAFLFKEVKYDPTLTVHSLNPVFPVAKVIKEEKKDQKALSDQKKQGQNHPNEENNKGMKLSKLLDSQNGVSNDSNKKKVSENTVRNKENVQNKYLTIGSERISFSEKKEGKGWSYSYDQTKKRGALLLAGYQGASLGSCGIDLDITVQEGTENTVQGDGKSNVLFVKHGKLRLTGSGKGTGKLVLSVDKINSSAEQGPAVLFAQDGIDIENLTAMTISSVNRCYGIEVENGGLSLTNVSLLDVATKKNIDSVHVGGPLALTCSASAKIILEGALWHRGKFSVQGIPGHQEKDRPIDSVTGTLFMTLKLLDKKIDRVLLTSENLEKTINPPANEQVFLLAANIDAVYDLAVEKEGKLTFLNVIDRKLHCTMLSSGNWTIKRAGKRDKILSHEWLRVYGDLVLGSPMGMGSSTLTIDGGSERKEILEANDAKAFVSGDIFCKTEDNRKYSFTKYKVVKETKNVLISVYGSLKMYSGVSIQNNINTLFFINEENNGLSQPEYAGGVYIADNGIFEMYGGKVTQCQAPLCGGVAVNGIFRLYDGEISMNTGYNNGVNKVEGAGVGIRAGVFEMYGGKITGNLALADNTAQEGSRAAKGGGIHISGRSKAIISGGSITNNLCLWGGGGIYVGGRGTSELLISQNAEISNNFAILGAGIYMNSSVKMEGGRIENNSLVEGVSATLPRGAGIYIREWGNGDLATKGPVFTISKDAFLGQNDRIYIVDNKVAKLKMGQYVYAPISVLPPLTDYNQKFVVSIGSAAASVDKTIRIVSIENVVDEKNVEKIASCFDFGYLGYKNNEKFHLESYLDKTSDFPKYYLVLKKGK